MSSGNLSYGQYEIKKKADGSPWVLGRGGMGVMFLAHDTLLSRDVALKVISPDRLQDEAARERFMREAKANGRLHHRNIGSVFQFGQVRNTCYYAMEYIDGQTLQEVLKERGRIPQEEALEIIRQVASALSEAEKHRIVHRDIKPANIMLKTESDGAMVVKLIDFGLAKAAAREGTATTVSEALTIDGGYLGTVMTSSPEQCRSEPLDTRSDIYSLGVVLWLMLIGQAPFTDTNEFKVVMHHLESTPPWKELSGLPKGVHHLLKAMLAKRREERPQTIQELLELIDTARGVAPRKTGAPPAKAAGKTRSKRRRIYLRLAASLLVLAGVGAGLAWNGQTLSGSLLKERVQTAGHLAFSWVDQKVAALTDPEPSNRQKEKEPEKPDSASALGSTPAAPVKESEKPSPRPEPGPPDLAKPEGAPDLADLLNLSANLPSPLMAAPETTPGPENTGDAGLPPPAPATGAEQLAATTPVEPPPPGPGPGEPTPPEPETNPPPATETADPSPEPAPPGGEDSRPGTESMKPPAPEEPKVEGQTPPESVTEEPAAPPSPGPSLEEQLEWEKARLNARKFMEQVDELDGKQGFARPITDLQVRLKEAEFLWEKEEKAGAAATYNQIVSEAESLLAKDRLRQRTVQRVDPLGERRNDFPKEWNEYLGTEIEAFDKHLATLLENVAGGRFEDADAAIREATREVQELEKTGGEISAWLRVREGFLEAATPDKELLNQHGGPTWKEVVGLIREGEDLNRSPLDRKSSYLEAREKLGAARKEAQARVQSMQAAEKPPEPSSKPPPPVPAAPEPQMPTKPPPPAEKPTPPPPVKSTIEFFFEPTTAAGKIFLKKGPYDHSEVSSPFEAEPGKKYHFVLTAERYAQAACEVTVQPGEKIRVLVEFGKRRSTASQMK